MPLRRKVRVLSVFERCHRHLSRCQLWLESSHAFEAVLDRSYSWALTPHPAPAHARFSIFLSVSSAAGARAGHNEWTSPTETGAAVLAECPIYAGCGPHLQAGMHKLPTCRLVRFPLLRSTSVSARVFQRRLRHNHSESLRAPHELADLVPEYDASNPGAMAFDIDRKISIMRAQSVDPALDPSKSLAERQQYMELAPAARASYGGAVDGATGGGRMSASNVDWLPYSSTKEKLEAWIQPNTNDYSSKANLLKQMSKAERD